MFAQTGGIYQSDLLLGQKWLQHSFGSRAAEDFPGDYYGVRQVHSCAVASAPGSGDPPQADAIVTAEPGLWIGVRTADCVPVLLADPVRRCIAVIHAGWRGTVANIAAAAVQRLQSDYGTSAADLLAAIGPCIGRCCFAVGEDVAGQFQDLFPEAVGLRFVDLPEANRRQLAAAGVDPEKIDMATLCTMCDQHNFHSYRRDKERSGRMVSAIRIES